MKKILWVSNVPIKQVAKACGLKVSGGGGWVQGLYEVIKNNDTIKLSICFPCVERDSFIGEVEGVSYFSFYQKKNLVGMSNPLAICQKTKEDIKKILDNVKPDILHIFGTEYSHTLLFLKTFNQPEKSIIHIQGLASAYYRYHYYADLPIWYTHFFVPSSIFRGTIASQQRIMQKRGKNEIKALQSASYILGRTDWDLACTQDTSKAEYKVCNEILRKTFYEEDRVWEYEKCEKHSIFASQASYPLKGLHYLLLALPTIVKEFPDTKLYVAGTDPIKSGSVKGIITRSPYGFYLNKLIKKYKLKGKVIFTGVLSEEKMKEKYLNANVFVLSSAIENSPNSLGEAMILGVPSVSANVGGVSTMLVHNKEGLLYQYNEIHMLSYYIRKVFRDNTYAKEIGKAAREHALITHNRDTIGEKVQRLYDEIINKGKTF